MRTCYDGCIPKGKEMDFGFYRITLDNGCAYNTYIGSSTGDLISCKEFRMLKMAGDRYLAINDTEVLGYVIDTEEITDLDLKMEIKV